MLGILPIDTIIDILTRPERNEIDIERLHKLMTDIPHTPEPEEEASEKDHPDTTEEDNEPDTPTDT